MADSTEGGSQPEEKQAPPPTPTIRHDWYQTQSDVVVDILAKGVKKEGAAVEFSERKVRLLLVTNSFPGFILQKLVVWRPGNETKSW